MRRLVRAERTVALDPERALGLWTDVRRWPTFVEGFARSLELDEAWPAEGARVVWESGPGGRGRVTERVQAYERGPPALFSTHIYEQRLSGTQSVRFEGGLARLELEYELSGSPLLRGPVDYLFIRPRLGDALGRTLRRFAAEAQEEAELRA